MVQKIYVESVFFNNESEPLAPLNTHRRVRFGRKAERYDQTRENTVTSEGKENRRLHIKFQTPKDNTKRNQNIICSEVSSD